jgi:rubrerythrin
MNVFDYAIRLEERGVQLFEQLKQDTENHELRQIFDSLRSMEEEHLTSLRAMKQVVTAEEAKSTMVDRAWQVKDGFEKLLESSDILHELKMDPDGFYHIVKAEEENIRMLEGMAATEPSETASLLLQELADEEKKHLEVIENIYDFMEKPHTYLEWGEFSNLNQL